MNISSKLMCAAILLFAVVGVATGGPLKAAHADSAPVTAKDAPVTAKDATRAAQPRSCVGERAFRIEVDHPRDVQLSMSRGASSSGWNAQLTAIGKVTTLGDARPCTDTQVQIFVEERDARAALQTCATIGATVASGQKLVVGVRVTDAAQEMNNAITERLRTTAGPLRLNRPVQIDCGVE